MIYLKEIFIQVKSFFLACEFLFLTSALSIHKTKVENLSVGQKKNFTKIYFFFFH